MLKWRQEVNSSKSSTNIRSTGFTRRKPKSSCPPALDWQPSQALTTQIVPGDGMEYKGIGRGRFGDDRNTPDSKYLPIFRFPLSSLSSRDAGSNGRRPI